MGRCHVLWFSFFVLTIDHPSLSISSFLKFVPVSHLYLNRPSRHDGFSSNLEVDHRKWQPCGNNFTFQRVLLVFPFYEFTCHASFWFTIVIPSHIFPSPIVHPCIIKGGSKSSTFNSSYRVSLFISCTPSVDFLPCYFMAFCSDLASFPQSK